MSLCCNQVSVSHRSFGINFKGSSPSTSLSAAYRLTQRCLRLRRSRRPFSIAADHLSNNAKVHAATRDEPLHWTPCSNCAFRTDYTHATTDHPARIFFTFPFITPCHSTFPPTHHPRYHTSSRISVTSPTASLCLLCFPLSSHHRPTSIRPAPPTPAGRRHTESDMLWTSWTTLVPLLVLAALLLASASTLVERRAATLNLVVVVTCVLIYSVGYVDLESYTPSSLYGTHLSHLNLDKLDRFCEENASMMLFGAAVVWYEEPKPESLSSTARAKPIGLRTSGHGRAPSNSRVANTCPLQATATGCPDPVEACPRTHRDPWRRRARCTRCYARWHRRRQGHCELGSTTP